MIIAQVGTTFRTSFNARLQAIVHPLIKQAHDVQRLGTEFKYEVRQVSSSLQGNRLRVDWEWRPCVNILGRFS